MSFSFQADRLLTRRSQLRHIWNFFCVLPSDLSYGNMWLPLGAFVVLGSAKRTDREAGGGGGGGVCGGHMQAHPQESAVHVPPNFFSEGVEKSFQGFYASWKLRQRLVEAKRSSAIWPLKLSDQLLTPLMGTSNSHSIIGKWRWPQTNRRSRRAFSVPNIPPGSLFKHSFFCFCCHQFCFSDDSRSP